MLLARFSWIFFSHLKFYKFQISFFSIFIFQVQNNRKFLWLPLVVLAQSTESSKADTGGVLLNKVLACSFMKKETLTQVFS